MMAGDILPIVKPDADNIIKIICDGLNTVAYKDDKQIIDIYFTKKYSDRPRVEVEIYKR
jgi:Holliday junction resolvase RusA-like endonuclease